MKKMIDHEKPRRRAEFDLGHATENERIRHRLWALLAILTIAAGVVILGTAAVWIP